MTIVIKVAGKFRFLDFPGVDMVRKSILSNDFIDVLSRNDSGEVFEASLSIEGLVGIFKDPQRAIAAIAGGNILMEGAENDRDN